MIDCLHEELDPHFPSRAQHSDDGHNASPKTQPQSMELDFAPSAELMAILTMR
jgi:hypothetical protein